MVKGVQIIPPQLTHQNADTAKPHGGKTEKSSKENYTLFITFCPLKVQTRIGVNLILLETSTNSFFVG